MHSTPTADTNAGTIANTTAFEPAGPRPNPAPGDAPAPRVVLDSNIWIDLLAFRDPHVEAIRAALENGVIATLIRADCREELRRVLAHPQFARFDLDIARAL